MENNVDTELKENQKKEVSVNTGPPIECIFLWPGHLPTLFRIEWHRQRCFGIGINIFF